MNDARGALRLTDRRYDAIVSQPSHPWTAGASHLYTREFMQLAHDHLNSGGVFVQWMNVIFMDEDLLRSLTATLLKRVPRGAGLSARSEHRGVPGERCAARCWSSSWRAAVCRCAMRRCTTRGSASTMSRTSWPRWYSTRKARDAWPPARRLITDDDNRIATSSVFEKGRGMTGDTSGRLFAAYDPLQRADSVVYGPLKESLSFPYLARRNGVFVLLDPSLADRVGRMSQFLTGDARGEYLRAYYFRMKNQTQRSTETLRLAIDDYPADDSLRLEFLRPWYGELAMGKAPAEIAEVADGLNAPAAQVLAAARHAFKSEWREVALADAALAEIPWTSVWYSEALELRVNWRLWVSDAAQPEAIRRRSHFHDRPPRHHEPDAEPLRPAHPCGIRRRAARGGGGVAVELRATRGGHGQARVSIRRNRCARTPARCAMYSTTWPNFRRSTRRASPRCAPRSPP